MPGIWTIQSSPFPERGARDVEGAASCIKSWLLPQAFCKSTKSSPYPSSLPGGVPGGVGPSRLAHTTQIPRPLRLHLAPVEIAGPARARLCGDKSLSFRYFSINSTESAVVLRSKMDICAVWEYRINTMAGSPTGRMKRRGGFCPVLRRLPGWGRSEGPPGRGAGNAPPRMKIAS